MRYRIHIGCLILLVCLGNPALANGGFKLEAMLLSLQQVQDRIADGDSAALPLQKHLMRMLDAGIAEAGPVDQMTDARLRVLFTFGLIGSGSGAVVQALSEIKSPGKDASIAAAVVDYRERKREQAIKQFSGLKSASIDDRLMPFVAFARGNILSLGAPDKAVHQYDLVRVLAPGTLLEEASLRRLMALHLGQRRGKKFISIAKQYTRRFVRSPYRSHYLTLLQKGLLAMRRSIAPEDAGALADLMPSDYAESFYLHLVRNALRSGHLKMARFGIGKVVALAQESDALRIKPAQLELLKLLAQLTHEEPVLLQRQLGNLDTSRLGPEDVALLNLARRVLTSILSPIDASKRPRSLPQAESSTGLQKDKNSGPANDHLTKSKSDDTDELIINAKKRLQAVDTLLGE